MSDDPFEPEIEIVEAEEVDGLPVLAEVREVQVVSSSAGAVRAAAAAATGFVAGAATLALARRYGGRRLARLQDELGLARRTVGGYPITSTRTYVVRVHVIGRPSE